MYYNVHLHFKKFYVIKIIIWKILISIEIQKLICFFPKVNANCFYDNEPSVIIVSVGL